MSYLIDEFCKCIIMYPEQDVNRIYNNFIKTRKEEEVEWMTYNFMLFIKAGEAIRQTDPALKTVINGLL